MNENTFIVNTVPSFRQCAITRAEVMVQPVNGVSEGTSRTAAGKEWVR